jgi:predicted metalloprotease
VLRPGTTHRRSSRRPAIVPLLMASILVAAALTLALLLGGRGGWYEHPFDPFPPSGAQGSSETVPGAPEGVQPLVKFVVGDVQQFWAGEFRQAGLDYRPAGVVVFEDAIPTACGTGSEATGPFYCPADLRVYLEADFFRELAREFHAPGDFAQAYVIAHELGHHVQNLTGVMAQVQTAVAKGDAPRSETSIRLELQADCLAGVWAHSTYERGLLERGDLDEGLRAAAAVGDDRIQLETTGRVNPETWTHGSSEQRRSWLLRGFESGDPNACDTFSGDL